MGQVRGKKPMIGDTKDKPDRPEKREKPEKLEKPNKPITRKRLNWMAGLLFRFPNSP
jgi:hypothetical protein